ncbi:DUF2796 domain-containing protein [Aquipseudomonas ullengensis]|uniref:DUF2796 domain-containing protein n=1 Tax=Aquipseudomonas ullengensis TaxID=2759166 RepID=A0A7W4LLC6_9GAMM|nr:DUF2796 domain-containing protein [Pseudomonas ullengensis]MBB2495293.1 DUF2796 domain-containing protein [Pseudomonas ullengensis]
MRRTLLALSIALLPLSFAQAASHEHDHSHEEHGSLGAHEHGVASLNVALDGQTLEIQLESPAMNLVGFEHAASSDADKAKVAAARAQLEQPASLFNLPAAAGCTLAAMELHSPLFGKPAHEHTEAEHEHSHEHADVDADYRFDCNAPQHLTAIDLAVFFQQFPATEKLNAQLIGPSGQQGAELNKGNARLSF